MEVPYVEVVCGCVGVVRGREEVAKLHNRRECFGVVRVTKSIELRLMPEEEVYLATRGRIRVDARDARASVRSRQKCPESFDRRYAVYEKMRDKGYVVKSGLQFGTDYLLYRGTPDEYHAEYCCSVVDGKMTWRHLKTLARLAQDVRKRLLLCELTEEGDVVEVVVDDAFQRPPEANQSSRKRARNQLIAATAKKRR